MRKRGFLFFVLVCLTAAAVAEPESYELGAQTFIADMAARHGFDTATLQTLLRQARYRQDIIDTMNHPYESKPWSAYRPLFLTPDRVEAGVAYWRANADTLREAQQLYGVDPEIIVAIVGIESLYGKRTGNFPLLDSLTTLGFSYPKRADFFRGQLEEFLLFCREEKIDPRTVQGSYAGAMGQPQFISSSYRTYAVDFDGDGHRDLWHNDADVIGSVAHYLYQHGWQRRRPVAFPASMIAATTPEVSIAEKTPLAPNTTLGQLREIGMQWSDRALEDTIPATLVRLDGPREEYWIALANFYAITRYNHSNLYAMAVYQLGERIRARFTYGS